jgi:glycosyltransferase involved in cell wall biosynthesis
MLVANGVVGDSRVQKIARSMAEAGWSVTLVGRAPGGRTERFALGGADVVLVPVPKTVSGYERSRVRQGQGRTDAAERRAAYRVARAELARRDAGTSGRRRSAAAAAARGWLEARPTADRILGRLSSGPVGGGAKLLLAGGLGLADQGGGWRQLNPWFADLELAMAPVVAELKPDLIHAHDFHMVGIGARLAAALGTPGRPVRWIYDAHEYLAGIDVPGRWDARRRLRRRMLVGVEREYIGRADAVVTVSEGIASRLAADHRLAARPVVVLNAPIVGARRMGRGLRQDVGLDEEVPLLLYSGGMSPRRGVATVIDALVLLADVNANLALVARDDDPDVDALRRRAEERGVGDRLHVVPYVPVDEVVPYIESATIGVVPILHHPNHELSLITKYFEYLHACLPIVTSDVREMAETTRRLGVGEVFAAGDAASLEQAVRRVVADVDRYRKVYAGPDDPRGDSLWEQQAAKLDGLYRELLGVAAKD